MTSFFGDFVPNNTPSMSKYIFNLFTCFNYTISYLLVFFSNHLGITYRALDALDFIGFAGHFVSNAT